MSRTTSKRRRWARAEGRRRCRALRSLAITIDRERRRRLPPATGPWAFLDGILPEGWPYGFGVTGTIGGMSRSSGALGRDLNAARDHTMAFGGSRDYDRILVVRKWQA